MVKKISLLLCLMILVGCSTRKDAGMNRFYHRTTGWFNTLFNAEEELAKKIIEVEDSYEENYSEILPVDPRPPIKKDELTADEINRQAGMLSGRGRGNQDEPEATGFDLVEKKATKAIENHSMEISGKERNKGMNRAYLLLGKARYFKGKNFEALDAFNHLINRLPDNKKYMPEALMYSALANLEVGNEFEGERLLSKMYKDDGYKKKMKAEIAKNFAQHMIDKKEYEDALSVLDNAISFTKNKKKRARYHFIEGQLYSLLGDQNEAGEAFTRVFNLKPGFDMEVKSQLGIAANFDPESNSYSSYKEHLLNLANKGNYLSRKNELFYAVGDIAVKADKPDEARKYLKKSFEGAASDPWVRGLAYERYADLEFNERNYVFASAYYDSALTVAPYDKDIDRITERNTSLKKLMQKYYLVQKNDSILRIAAMSQEEKEQFFNDYIEKLKKEDEKKRRELEREATIFLTEGKGSNFGSTFDESGGNFYFYSTSQKSRGKTDFERIWGNIKLSDDWRSSASGGKSLEDLEKEMLGQEEVEDFQKYDLDYYLGQIPSKPTEINKLKIERDTAELSLGIGYYDEFKDGETSVETLKHLLSTPPKQEETDAQANYQLYRIYNKTERTAEAEKYKDFILTNYPFSIYAEYILNPEFEYITPTTKEALALYEETYEKYLEDDYAKVRENTALAIEKYPTEEIIAKFSLLNAYATGKLDGREEFISALELILVAYQNTPEAEKAQEILDYLNGKGKAVAENKTDLKEGISIPKDQQKNAEDQKRKEDAMKKREQQERAKAQESRRKEEQQRKNPGAKNSPVTPPKKDAPKRMIR